MIEHRTCPTCGAAVEADPGWTAWCRACGWNLKPYTPRKAPGRLDRFLARVGSRAGRSLADDVIRNGARKPRATLATVLAVVLCLAIFLILIGSALWSIRTLLFGHPPIVFVPLLLFAILLPIAARPRIPSFDVETLDRTQLPATFELVDGVAAAVGVPSVDAIVIEPEFNAAYARSGLRRRTLLFIGLPLWMSSDPQSRVAVLAHELGHGANNDPTRGLILGSGLNALVHLHLTLEPRELFPREEGLTAYIGLPITLIFLGLSRLVLALIVGLVALASRSQQRAEYYADALGVRAAGKPAMRRMLDALHASKVIDGMVWINETTDPVGTIAAAIRGLPAGERERIRRVERLDGSRLDYSHPPTSYRIDVIESLAEAPAAFVFGQAMSDRVDAELETFQHAMGRRIVEDYLVRVGS